MELFWDGKMTKLPLELEMTYIALRGNMVK
jgi:hypothetical protein